MINDLKDGFSANGIYIVKSVAKGVSQNAAATTYLNVVLQDCSGTIEAKKWDASPADVEKIKAGAILRIEGQAYDYKDKLQVKIMSAYEIKPEEVNLNNLVISSPIPVEDLIADFKKYYNSVKNKDCKLILTETFKKYYKQFIDFPAGVSCHHDFYHGLLYHTVSMCKLAEQIQKLYPEANYDLLISGCLLHDVGKVIELSGPLTTKYTTEGNLLGHITIGMSIIREISATNKIESEVPVLLEHMILSHHGKQEFGSPILPETREALLLSMIDDMDSKMMVLDKAYKNIAEGEKTDKIFSFDNRTFYKPHKID